MATIIGGGTAIEQGLSQFPRYVEMNMAEDLERVEAFLDYAEANPTETFYVTPDALGEVESTPELLELLESCGENIVLPRTLRGFQAGPRRTFLNVGKTGGRDFAWVSAHLPALRDTLLVCPPETAELAECLVQKGSGECAWLPVFPVDQFDDKYMGYAALARVWFSCWLSDSVLHWEAPITMGGPRSSLLAYRYGRDLSALFRLQVVFDSEAAIAA